MEIFKHTEPFFPELGGELKEVQIAYHTYGKINQAQDNVIWICHALTANSDAILWWDGMVGPGKFYDPARYFIICANYLGSCYGTTGPLSVNPATGKPWFRSFPENTVRDMVRAHELLRKHLGIGHIHTVIGGSIGGFQAMEWAICSPDIFSHVILIACSGKSSPWVIALNESQRLSILADKTFMDDVPEGGMNGLKAARSIALLSYRNGTAYNKTQSEETNETTGDFRASSYQQYQGEKLAGRFNAYSYFLLTKAIDSHNVARGRNSFSEAFGRIKARTLVVGISSDILFPIEEQKTMAALISDAEYREINSDFGHDGFLIESVQLSKIFFNFYNQ